MCRRAIVPMYRLTGGSPPLQRPARSNRLAVLACVRCQGSQPSVTELFRSPPLVSGTVFRRLAARHVSTVTGHLSQSPHVSSLQALLFITLILPLSCRVRELTCHYGDVNRFCYLLTYLLTYHCHLTHRSGRHICFTGRP